MINVGHALIDLAQALHDAETLKPPSPPKCEICRDEVEQIALDTFVKAVQRGRSP